MIIELKFPIDFILKFGFLPVILLIFFGISLFHLKKNLIHKNRQASYIENYAIAGFLITAILWALIAVPNMMTDKILVDDETIEFQDLIVELKNVCQIQIFSNNEDGKLYWKFFLNNGNSETIFENDLIEIHKKELLQKFIESGMYFVDDDLSLKRDSC